MKIFVALEQAQKNVNFSFTLNPLIQQFINYYQGRNRSTMENGLRRSGQYMKLARKIFAEEGVPLDITWLGQVESAWKTESGFVGGGLRTVAVYSEHRPHVWLATERLHRRAKQY